MIGSGSPDDDDGDVQSDQSCGVVVMIIIVMMTTFMAIIVRTLKRDVDRIRVWRALELIQRLLVAADRSIGKKKWKKRSIWLSSKVLINHLIRQS